MTAGDVLTLTGDPSPSAQAFEPVRVMQVLDGDDVIRAQVIVNNDFSVTIRTYDASSVQQASAQFSNDGSVQIVGGLGSIGIDTSGNVSLNTSGANLNVTADGTIADQNDVMEIEPSEYRFRLNGGVYINDNVSDGAPGKVAVATAPEEAEYGAKFIWKSLVTFQFGTPVGGGLLTPLVFDGDATTGGLYAWDGFDYELIGLATT